MGWSIDCANKCWLAPQFEKQRYCSQVKIKSSFSPSLRRSGAPHSHLLQRSQPIASSASQNDSRQEGTSSSLSLSRSLALFSRKQSEKSRRGVEPTYQLLVYLIQVPPLDSLHKPPVSRHDEVSAASFERPLSRILAWSNCGLASGHKLSVPRSCENFQDKKNGDRGP